MKSIFASNKECCLVYIVLRLSSRITVTVSLTVDYTTLIYSDISGMPAKYAGGMPVLHIHTCTSYTQEVDLIIEVPKFINGAGQLVVTLMHKIEPQLL